MLLFKKYSPCMSQGTGNKTSQTSTSVRSSFYFPDSFYLGFHCMVSLFCLARTCCINRSATTWQQTRGPSSPVLSPASSEVKWDAINCTEYAKKEELWRQPVFSSTEVKIQIFKWLNLSHFLLLEINRISKNKVAEYSQTVNQKTSQLEKTLIYLSCPFFNTLVFLLINTIHSIFGKEKKQYFYPVQIPKLGVL